MSIEFSKPMILSNNYILNRRYFKGNISRLKKLNFKHRKKIYYTLVATVILLEISITALWYTESIKETEVSLAFENLDAINELSQMTNKANNSFISSQTSFNDYINYQRQISLKEYTSSLIDIKNTINRVNTMYQEDHALGNVLGEKKESEYKIASVETTIDSIIALQIEPSKNQKTESSKFQKVEFKKTLNNQKNDFFILADSISKKSLFSRLTDAIGGKIDIQKMPEFNTLKRSSFTLRSQNQEIVKLNNKLLKLVAGILIPYSVTLNNLQLDTKNKMRDEYKSSVKLRNYTAVMMILLMFIITLVISNFTQMASDYDKKITKAKERIRQSLNFKNKIMGMISHEIRSPLNIISIYSKKISDSMKDPELKETFKSIHFTTNSLVLLANQILEYSKGQNYQPTLKCKKFNLKNEIHQIISSMSPLLELKRNKIEINSNIDSNCDVYSDVTKIHQLFYNLIGNANKFTEKGIISITINLQDISDYERNLSVEIHDNGIGIDDNDLKKIFESYYQGTSSRKLKDLGAGLGLNLCKEIVELYDGDINVFSVEGSGTTVTFNLILSQI